MMIKMVLSYVRAEDKLRLRVLYQTYREKLHIYFINSHLAENNSERFPVKRYSALHKLHTVEEYCFPFGFKGRRYQPLQKVSLK